MSKQTPDPLHHRLFYLYPCLSIDRNTNCFPQSPDPAEKLCRAIALHLDRADPIRPAAER